MNIAIAVLSSGLKKDKLNGWISTPIDDQDEKSGAPGGNLRILAASLVFSENHSWPVIASGGIGSEKNWENEPRPLLSQVLKKELIERGVPAEMIIEENSSKSTFDQLREILKLAKHHGFDKVMLISNRYHLPRIKAFIDYFPELSDLAGKLELLEAEDIVIRHDPGLKQSIAKAYSGQRMKIVLQNERQGVKDMEAGNYKI